MPKVKGVAILGMIKFIKKNFKDALPRVIKALPPESSKYMQEHILITEWYQYKLYTDLLRSLDKVIGKGDLSFCIEQGRLSAQHDLTTVYKIFMSFSNIENMVKRAMSIWNSYYDTGTVEAILFTDKEGTIIIKDFPDIDMAHVKNVQGWLEQFLSTGRLKDIKSEILRCQCYGDPLTELHFTFKS